ncbi:MAG: hypothetical protein HYY01_07870 [Chloroflexi bacterium]|nr:hypothetical protein [Chloroflexota bacterium]
MDDAEALFSTHGRVEELQFDEAFLQHLAERGTYRKHVVSVQEIVEAHGGTPRYFLNAGTGRAPVIMVGTARSGRCLVVPMEPTGQVGIWRPVTAFEANRHHRQRYEGSEQ